MGKVVKPASSATWKFTRARLEEGNKVAAGRRGVVSQSVLEND